MISDTLPLGPRRTAVAKAERDVIIAEANLNLAIDNRDWGQTPQLLAQLRAARSKVDDVLAMWIMDIPGAAEFFNPKEKAGGAG